MSKNIKHQTPTSDLLDFYYAENHFYCDKHGCKCTGFRPYRILEEINVCWKLYNLRALNMKESKLLISN
jgi:hypothetical protein